MTDKNKIGNAMALPGGFVEQIDQGKLRDALLREMLEEGWGEIVFRSAQCHDKAEDAPATVLGEAGVGKSFVFDGEDRSPLTKTTLRASLDAFNNSKGDKLFTDHFKAIEQMLDKNKKG